MKALISTEDALLFSLFKASKVYGKKFSDNLADAIEQYYFTVFETELDDYYKQTTPQIEKMYTVLYQIKNKAGESVYANLFSILLSFEEARNKNSVLGKEKITKSQWAVLILLSGIIFYCLLYLNTNEAFFQVLVIIVSSILVLILLTMRDLQELRLGGKLMKVFESGQEVLESMGKLHYYTSMLLEEGAMKIPERLKEYRLGVHEPGEDRDIKIIKRD